MTLGDHDWLAERVLARFDSGAAPTAGAMAISCHLFVIGYEEPTLRRFGRVYEQYLGMVHRWVPHPPGRAEPGPA